MKSLSASGMILLCGGVFTLTGSVSIAAALFLTKHMDAVRLHGTGSVEMLPIIFGLVGVVSLLTGCGILAACGRKQALRRRLLCDGVYITARITGFPANSRVRVNRMPTFRIECGYQDPASGTLHIFRSEPLLINPAGYVRQENVRVYLDPESDYRTYYVDLEGILPEIRRH